MDEQRQDNHGPENRLLDEMIAAVRADVPNPAQTARAQERLAGRLARARDQRPEPRRANVIGMLWGTRRRALGSALSLAAAVLTMVVLATLPTPRGAQAEPLMGAGDLLILGNDRQVAGACPLRHTDVQANLVGLVGRVTVTQTFQNPSADKIEAVYVFPLPENAAVDAMTIILDGRRVVGRMLPKPEARAAYDAAKAAGHVAALLDQERPNIFTQSVANIEPGATVEVEISYVQQLKYQDGALEFVYPMVIAPRFHPSGGGDAVTNAGPSAATPGGSVGVPDAARITPPSAPPDTRPGHDISLTVRVDAGLQIQKIASPLHDAVIDRPGPTQAVVKLKSESEIPNRDFILKIETATEHIGDALLVQSDARGTFFSLILEPPKWSAPEQIVPKEMIFVIDRSSSMRGWKIEKAKAAMRKCIESLTPEDTFSVISFSNGIDRLYPEPAPATPENIPQGLAFIDNIQANGGTQMLPALREALRKPGVNLQDAVGVDKRPSIDPNLPLRGIYRSNLPEESQAQRIWGALDGPWLVSTDAAWALPLYDAQGLTAGLSDGKVVVLRGRIDPAISPERLTLDAVQPERVRFIGFMTDGQVGNDFEILDEVRRNAGTTRVFGFGVGDSTNRFLLQGMGDLGRGAVEFVDEKADPAEAAGKFFVHVHAPLLTDVAVDWGGLAVEELYPDPLPDLFSARPVTILGRMRNAPDAAATVTLRGQAANGAFERKVTLQASAAPGHGSALASLWARARIEHLTRQDMRALQQGDFPDEVKQQITQLGVEYGLMTQFTSFVAVDELVTTRPGPVRRADVPAATPQGEFGADSSGVSPSADAVINYDPETNSIIVIADQVQQMSISDGRGGGRGRGGMAGGRGVAPTPNANRALSERLRSADHQSKVARVQADLRSLATGVESYFVDQGAYPAPDSGGFKDNASLVDGDLDSRTAVRGSSSTSGPAMPEVLAGSGAAQSYHYAIQSVAGGDVSGKGAAAPVDGFVPSPVIADNVPAPSRGAFVYPDALNLNTLAVDPDSTVENAGTIRSYHEDTKRSVNSLSFGVVDASNGTTSMGDNAQVKQSGEAAPAQPTETASASDVAGRPSASSESQAKPQTPANQPSERSDVGVKSEEAKKADQSVVLGAEMRSKEIMDKLAPAAGPAQPASLAPAAAKGRESLERDAGDKGLVPAKAVAEPALNWGLIDGSEATPQTGEALVEQGMQRERPPAQSLGIDARDRIGGTAPPATAATAPASAPAKPDIADQVRLDRKVIEDELSLRSGLAVASELPSGAVAPARRPASVTVEGTSTTATARLGRGVRVGVIVPGAGAPELIAHLTTSTLVTSIYITRPPNVRDARTRWEPDLILGVWRDGTLVWSGDQGRGGAPYFTARIDPAAIETLLTRLRTQLWAAQSQREMSAIVPDSTDNRIVVLDGPRSAHLCYSPVALHPSKPNPPTALLTTYTWLQNEWQRLIPAQGQPVELHPRIARIRLP